MSCETNPSYLGRGNATRLIYKNNQFFFLFYTYNNQRDDLNITDNQKWTFGSRRVKDLDSPGREHFVESRSVVQTIEGFIAFQWRSTDHQSPVQ